MERYFRSQDSWCASAGPRGGASAQSVVPMLRLSDLDRARGAPELRAAAFERVQASALLLLRPCLRNFRCTRCLAMPDRIVARTRMSTLQSDCWPDVQSTSNLRPPLSSNRVRHSAVVVCP